MSADVPPIPDMDLSRFPRQVTSNKLVLGTGSGFRDVTIDAEVSRSNWSWNARALDVDSDGYLDLFVGNGYGLGSVANFSLLPDIQVHSNVLYRNISGEKFESSAHKFGLTDYLNTPSFVVLDVDLDGDMDLITYAQVGGLRLYENQVTSGSSLTFQLSDGMGNRGCVGCKIILETDRGRQIREIKLSGGFLSYDEARLHFGVVAGDSVRSVRVVWSTGEQTPLDVPFSSGRHYRVTRKSR